MRARGSKPLTLAAACAAVFLSAPLAFGQEQAATAEALFREARDLAGKGRFDEACPKFAASQKLDPGYGTIYNLGECLAHQGRTASAWAAFHEAAAMAKTAGQAERETKANRAAAALEAQLERMVISVKAPPAGLSVKRGGVVIDSAAWGSALPVDPGKHVIEATAPGKKPLSIEVAGVGPGKSVTVEIPPLEDAPPEPAGLTAPVGPGAPPPADGAAARRIAAYATGGAGVVGIVVGSIMGASAKSKWDEAQSQHCKTPSLCDAQGVNLVSSAKTAATASTVGFVAGGALLATGVVLLVTALPSSRRATSRLVVSPTVEPTRAGVVVIGSF